LLCSRAEFDPRLDQGVKALADACAASSTLTRLDARSNFFSRAGGKALGHMLQKYHGRLGSLDVLDLRDCELGGDERTALQFLTRADGATKLQMNMDTVLLKDVNPGYTKGGRTRNHGGGAPSGFVKASPRVGLSPVRDVEAMLQRKPRFVVPELGVTTTF